MDNTAENDEGGDAFELGTDVEFDVGGALVFDPDTLLEFPKVRFLGVVLLPCFVRFGIMGAL